jgi:membrane-bound lytic murein transglycosylase B
MAEELYGVPPEIVVGIVGVESIYGRQMGNFRIIDALATLASTSRSAARTAATSSETSSRTGSCSARARASTRSPGRAATAGAIGMAQFMPSSFNKYAVDLDGDGRVNLHEQRRRRDRQRRPLHGRVRLEARPAGALQRPAAGDTADRAALLAPDIVPTFSAAEMQARGAALPPEAASVDSALALVELENGRRAPSYVAGTSNFYAVTRYNWSSYYALAVVELGEAVRGAPRAAFLRRRPSAALRLSPSPPRRRRRPARRRWRRRP